MTDNGIDRLQPLLDRQRAAFLRDGPPALAQRRELLAALRQAILDHRVPLAEALDRDFGNRARQETEYLELVPLIQGIDYLQRHLRKFMRPERRGTGLTFWPASNRVERQPLGVIGIVSPWNYPVALALMPLATAFAAGNRAMIKPSELTPATTAVMAEMMEKAFGRETVAVIAGGAEIAEAFSSLPFDHLVFTGSTAVGREVMRAASANLVPVTLELGGKSPAIVGPGADIGRAAERIAWGKLANAGQTCIAPDHVLVPEEEIDRFLAAFEAAVKDLYPAIATHPDYTTIISDRHFQRLADWVEDARGKGAQVREVGGGSPRRTHSRTFPPILLTGVTNAMKVASEEIFGPVLPVIPYREIHDVIARINDRPRPLALYYFGPDGPARREVLERTTSGGVAINDTLLHYAQDDLPFGGVGESGMGAYHGREGFLALSHAKAVFKQSPLNFTGLIRPPFGKGFDRLMRFLLGSP